MRLAYVTTGYPYVSHTFIQNEVLALRALGVQVDTFAVTQSPPSECRTPTDREARDTTYALRPPRLHHYVHAHVAALLTRPMHYLRAIARAVRMAGFIPRDVLRHLAYFVQAVVLWSRCRAARIGHIHAHFANVSSDVALLAAIVGGEGFTWSYTMHGPTEFYDLRYHRLATKAEAASFVICISDFARSQLMALVAPDQWPKLHVVHCGVDIERFTPAPRANGDGVTRITCVGRLVPEKGQSVLIEAVAAMRAAGLQPQLTIVGDGPRRPALEQLARSLGIADRTRFLGAVAHTEVEVVLRQTDIFCLPSFAEGVPIVLMEAMAMELPVVACGVMGIPELIEDHVNGRLVRPGSASDLADALTSLAGDPRTRRDLGAAARARVAAEYELGANARRLAEIYSARVGVAGPALQPAQPTHA